MPCKENRFTTKLNKIYQLLESVANHSSLEVLQNKTAGTSKKEFKKIDEKLPCFKCIVLAACKGKSSIECDIVIQYMQMCIAYGTNTLQIQKDLADLFPNSQSLNGTVIL